MNWLLHVLGVDDVSGRWYAFWSGFAGDIALIGAGFAIVRRHNCHVKGCWRVGRQQVEGTTFVVCRLHHPEGKPTAERVKREWRERTHMYLGNRPGTG